MYRLLLLSNGITIGLFRLKNNSTLRIILSQDGQFCHLEEDEKFSRNLLTRFVPKIYESLIQKTLNFRNRWSEKKSFFTDNYISNQVIEYSFEKSKITKSKPKHYTCYGWEGVKSEDSDYSILICPLEKIISFKTVCMLLPIDNVTEQTYLQIADLNSMLFQSTHKLFSLDNPPPFLLPLLSAVRYLRQSGKIDGKLRLESIDHLRFPIEIHPICHPHLRTNSYKSTINTFNLIIPELSLLLNDPLRFPTLFTVKIEEYNSSPSTSIMISSSPTKQKHTFMSLDKNKRTTSNPSNQLNDDIEVSVWLPYNPLLSDPLHHSNDSNISVSSSDSIPTSDSTTNSSHPLISPYSYYGRDPQLPPEPYNDNNNNDNDDDGMLGEEPSVSSTVSTTIVSLLGNILTIRSYTHLANQDPEANKSDLYNSHGLYSMKTSLDSGEDSAGDLVEEHIHLSTLDPSAIFNLQYDSNYSPLDSTSTARSTGHSSFLSFFQEDNFGRHLLAKLLLLQRHRSSQVQNNNLEDKDLVNIAGVGDRSLVSERELRYDITINGYDTTGSAQWDYLEDLFPRSSPRHSLPHQIYRHGNPLQHQHQRPDSVIAPVTDPIDEVVVRHRGVRLTGVRAGASWCHWNINCVTDDRYLLQYDAMHPQVIRLMYPDSTTTVISVASCLELLHHQRLDRDELQVISDENTHRSRSGDQNRTKEYGLLLLHFRAWLAYCTSNNNDNNNKDNNNIKNVCDNNNKDDRKNRPSFDFFMRNMHMFSSSVELHLLADIESDKNRRYCVQKSFRSNFSSRRLESMSMRNLSYDDDVAGDGLERPFYSSSGGNMQDIVASQIKACRTFLQTR